MCWLHNAHIHSALTPLLAASEQGRLHDEIKAVYRMWLFGHALRKEFAQKI